MTDEELEARLTTVMIDPPLEGQAAKMDVLRAFRELRADLARVTEERDRLAAAYRAWEDASYGRSDERPDVARANLHRAANGNYAALAARDARIRAEARAAAREEAAQEAERRASVEGDKKWAAAYRKAATRIRALANGKDG